MHSHRRSCGGNFRKMVEYTDGKPYIGKINEIRHPIVYLYRSRRSKDMNKISYQREFNYCFNCGIRHSIDISNDESHCYLPLRKQRPTGAIEVTNDGNDRQFNQSDAYLTIFGVCEFTMSRYCRTSRS